MENNTKRIAIVVELREADSGSVGYVVHWSSSFKDAEQWAKEKHEETGLKYDIYYSEIGDDFDDI